MYIDLTAVCRFTKSFYKFYKQQWDTLSFSIGITSVNHFQTISFFFVCCCTTLLHTLFCHETSSLRVSIHRHVNWAPYREISSLLVLREACPCSTCYDSQRGCPLTHQPPTYTQQCRKPIHHWNKTQGYTVLYIDLRTLVPADRPSDTIVTGYATLTQSWTFGHSLRTRQGARQRLVSAPQCLPLSSYAYRAGLPCHWIHDTRAEKKISAASQICCWQSVRLWLPCQVLSQMFGFVKEIWWVCSVELENPI